MATHAVLSSVIEQIEVGREECFDIACFKTHNGCKIQNIIAVKTVIRRYIQLLWSGCLLIQFY
jgi:hypothetical protein